MVIGPSQFHVSDCQGVHSSLPNGFGNFLVSLLFIFREERIERRTSH